MSTIILTGCNGGLGREIAHLMSGPRNYIIGIDQQPESHSIMAVNEYIRCCLDELEPTQQAVKRIQDRTDRVDILINCAGAASINWLHNITCSEYDDIQAVNARAIFLLTQGLLPQLIKAQGTVLNILSDAAYRPMTASLAYNVSKAAAEMMTQQMARELGRQYGITVFGIAPAKLADTPMSRFVDERVAQVRGWTPEYVEQYHRAGVTMKEDIPVAVLAQFIAHLLYCKDNHRWLNGCILPYGG